MPKPVTSALRALPVGSTEVLGWPSLCFLLWILAAAIVVYKNRPITQACITSLLFFFFLTKASDFLFTTKF